MITDEAVRLAEERARLFGVTVGPTFVREILEAAYPALHDAVRADFVTQGYMSVREAWEHEGEVRAEERNRIVEWLRSADRDLGVRGPCSVVADHIELVFSKADIGHIEAVEGEREDAVREVVAWLRERENDLNAAPLDWSTIARKIEHHFKVSR